MPRFTHRDDDTRQLCVTCGSDRGLHAWPDRELSPWGLADNQKAGWFYERGVHPVECQQHRDLWDHTVLRRHKEMSR